MHSIVQLLLLEVLSASRHLAVLLLQLFLALKAQVIS